MFIIKTKLKFKDDKNCLEAAPIEIKINHLEKNKTYVDSLKEFKKTNKLILKKQQRFRSQRCNAFTEEINKIALNSNHGKRIKSIDSIETYNPNWPESLDHPYRIVIFGGSGSRKANALLNLINHEPDIDKLYLYAKDPFKVKY